MWVNLWSPLTFEEQKWPFSGFNEGQKSDFTFFFSELKNGISSYWSLNNPSCTYGSLLLTPFSFFFSFFLVEPPNQPPFVIVSSPPSTRTSPRESPTADDATPRSLDKNDKQRSHEESSKFTPPSRIFAFSGVVWYLFREVRPDLECTLDPLQNHTPFVG